MDPIPLQECKFLVPIRRDHRLSDGELHSTEAWEWLTDEFYERFQAITIAPGLYEGLWKDPVSGDKVPDQSRQYIIALRLNGLANCVTC